MAAKSSPKVFPENNTENIDCAVCLQPCVHPTILPCRHVFCFLCVKGLGRTTRTCAMCRQQFPLELLEKPSLLRPVEESLSSGFDDGQQWYYEGRNALKFCKRSACEFVELYGTGGWWQYESRISAEIEQAYKGGEKQLEIIICGELYIIDLEKKVQYPKQNRIRRRNIQRSSVKNTRSKGWWQYDERTSVEIEMAYQKGNKTCEVSIAGRIYVIDFDKMLQQQKLSVVQARRIKRDLITIPKKGISGIRTPVRVANNDDLETRIAMLNLFGLQDD